MSEVKETYYIGVDYTDPTNPNKIHLYLSTTEVKDDMIVHKDQIVCTFKNLDMVVKFADDWDWQLPDAVRDMLPCVDVLATPSSIQSPTGTEPSVDFADSEPVAAPLESTHTDAAQPVVKRRRGRPPRQKPGVVSTQPTEQGVTL